MSEIIRLPMQGEKERAQTILPATCCVCGKEDSTLYCAIQGDKWVKWREVYTKEIRRFLCNRCIRLYRPSMVYALATGDRALLKKIPIFDATGNMLPTTRKIQLELIPNFFPATWLGDNLVKVSLISHFSLHDCIGVKMIPELGQDYYLDKFMSLPQFGCIYTCLHTFWQFPRYKPDNTVQFQTFWSKNGKYKEVSLVYRPSHFKEKE